MAKYCLYCALQLPATADFCSECGRPVESGFEIRSIQEAEFDYLRKEREGKDVLPGQQEFYTDSIKTGKLENNEMLAREHSPLASISCGNSNERRPFKTGCWLSNSPGFEWSPTRRPKSPH